MKLFSILLFILLIPLASAQCVDIKLAKSSYLSQETLQAEITGNLLRTLTYNDISFSYNGQEYFPTFIIQQISSNKWIIFGEVKERYGLNELSVNKVLCRENNTLKEETKTVQFSVNKPVQDYFSDFLENIRWSSLTDDELMQSAIALSDFSAEGKNEIMKRGGDCWPSESCSVKSTSLAILALNDSNKTESAKKWLTDSQNSIDIGIWKLITSSLADQQCNLTINNQSSEILVPAGTNELSLELPDTDMIYISLNCSVSARISHTYLGIVHDISLGTINNKKCWGKSYRSSCDALSTAYALQIIEDADAEKWLSENAKYTEEIAYANYYVKDSTLEEWLINNQHISGYWSNAALAISTKADVFATVAAIKSLNEDAKAEKWLIDNFDSFSLEEKAVVLQLLKEKIEPLVSIQTGFIKTSSQNVTLKISNKGIFPVELKAELEGNSQSVVIPAKTTLPITLQVPSVSELTFLSIDLNYNLKNEERSYSIPVAVYSSGQEIDLISQNLTEGTIKTANFQFSDLIINETIDFGKERTINLSINNSGPAVTVDITLWGNISYIISSVPVSLELKANSETVLPVTFKASELNDYSGQIDIESKGKSASIPVYIKIKQIVSEKSCSDLGGQVCYTACDGNMTSTKQGNCCVGKCKEAETSKSSMKVWGILMIVAAVIIVAAFLFFKLKKPKKKHALEKVLSKIKEESRIQSFEESHEKKI